MSINLTFNKILEINQKNLLYTSRIDWGQRIQCPNTQTEESKKQLKLTLTQLT